MTCRSRQIQDSTLKWQHLQDSEIEPSLLNSNLSLRTKTKNIKNIYFAESDSLITFAQQLFCIDIMSLSLKHLFWDHLLWNRPFS